MRAKLAGVGLFAVALASAAGVPAQQAATTAITDIRQESSDRSTRLVVQCTGPLAYTYYSPDPLTLVVDIPEVDASQVPARVNVGTREVESVRVTSLARADGRNLARVEVRLASLVPYQIFSKDKALNLIFERPTSLAGATPAPAAAAAVPETAVVEAPRPKAAAATPAPAPPAPAPQPAVVAAAEPAASEPLPNGPKATRITAVTRDEMGALVAFTVKADGRLKYKDFLLANPERLVVDFADVSARAPMRQLEVGQTPVRQVRLGQFSAQTPKVARLVVDLSAKSPYRIIDGADGVRIVFGESAEPAAHAPLAAMRASEPEPHDEGRGGGGGRLDPVAPGLDRAARDAGAARAAGGGARHGRRGRSGAGQHRPGLRSDGRPRHSDQPRLQGRRPAGHLPALLGHLGPERRREPRRDRQGDAQAERGALGTRARADPEDERPRLRARGQRDPHRAAQRPPEARRPTAASSTRRRRSRASSRTTRGASPTPRPERSRPSSSRRGRSRRAARSTSTSAPTRSSSATCRPSSRRRRA